MFSLSETLFTSHPRPTRNILIEQIARLSKKLTLRLLNFTEILDSACGAGEAGDEDEGDEGEGDEGEAASPSIIDGSGSGSSATAAGATTAGATATTTGATATTAAAGSAPPHSAPPQQRPAALKTLRKIVKLCKIALGGLGYLIVGRVFGIF
ncbi:hypothetical protein BOX15_Mlig008203g1 [Macrostomum lignano]|uniref:Uncharacterized protein n=1 Tax=Macrostomum lignano TaxID=282301 RepID=A0A267FFJ7_9PLAT|nr:hypothetical protein BOX15_Mlig008203g1 [Macrostomum lignano]